MNSKSAVAFSNRAMAYLKVRIGMFFFMWFVRLWCSLCFAGELPTWLHAQILRVLCGFITTLFFAFANMAIIVTEY